jgi:hypothetical protein
VPSPVDLKLVGDIRTSTRNSVVCFVYIIVCLHFVNINKKNQFMDFLAVSPSNVLELGGYLHPSLTHNSVEPVFSIHRLCFMDINKHRNLAPF